VQSLKISITPPPQGRLTENSKVEGGFKLTSTVVFEFPERWSGVQTKNLCWVFNVCGLSILKHCNGNKCKVVN